MGLKQPDFEEKAHLQKKLHDPNDRYTFDDNARIFGNDHGISFLQSLQTQINHLNQMLSPNVRHVYSIRTPILYQFANTRKPLPSSIRHHRNQIAHGGANRIRPRNSGKRRRSLSEAGMDYRHPKSVWSQPACDELCKAQQKNHRHCKCAC